jgi:hypothetical protein
VNANPETPPASTATTPPAPAASVRKRKRSSPRAPRTVDPGISAIRKEFSDKVKAYRSAQASSGILKTIIEKRLPKLTAEHRRELYDLLCKMETPKLI